MRGNFAGMTIRRLPRRIFQSMGFTLAALTRSRTCPGPGSPGSATSRTWSRSLPPYPSITAAFIAISPCKRRRLRTRTIQVMAVVERVRRGVSLALLAAALLASALPAAAVDARDVLGVAHAAGRYNFTGEDYLNEGADRVLEVGSRVI